MSQEAIQKIQKAMVKANKIRPKVGGFPYLAECLRQAGVVRNVWQLPSAQSRLYLEDDVIVIQNQPLVEGFSEIPAWNEKKFLKALRADQAGESTFPEWLQLTWEAGCVAYEIDFRAHRCTYYGINGETYIEDYPVVNIDE